MYTCDTYCVYLCILMYTLYDMYIHVTVHTHVYLCILMLTHIQ